MKNSKLIKLLFLVFICSHFSNAHAQSVYMIVEDTAPIYKTIQRYEDVPFTETVCYRYMRNSKGALEKIVDNGFGSMQGLIGAGIGVAIGEQIGSGSGNDAAKVVMGLIGNKVGNNVALEKEGKTSCEEVTTYHRNVYHETIVSAYNVTGKINGQIVTVQRPNKPLIGSSITVQLRVN